MRPADTLRFARDAARGFALRTALSVLAMSIGVAAVVILTALGDGARRYVVGQFASLGTNLVIVLPGRAGTGGFNPATAITSTPRDLTIDDASALKRAPSIGRLSPLLVGTSEISAGGRLREIIVAGTTSQYIDVRNFTLAEGRFLPDDDWRRGEPVTVIGSKIREEFFPNESPVGKLARIGDRRVRIIGVLAPNGQGLGMNTDEVAFVPVALAQALFNSNTLFRILMEARTRDAIPAARDEALAILKARHQGEEDVTVITQDAVLATFDKLLGTLTLGVAGIAAISLAVAGILVMNVMLVAVTQRTAEIGLLKALGATGSQIRNLFLTEAALLSTLGALLGFLLGHAVTFAIRRLFPMFPAWPPDWAVIAGIGTALATGLLFGVMPARRAAGLDPVNALMRH